MSFETGGSPNGPKNCASTGCRETALPLSNPVWYGWVTTPPLSLIASHGLALSFVESNAR